MNRWASDRGSASVELVLLTPLLVALALFVVLSGRSGESLRQIQHAADQGARAASQAGNYRRKSAGESAARRDIVESGLSCKNIQVGVEPVALRRFSGVRVEVSCEVEHSGLSILKIHNRRVSAHSIEIVDYYRAE